MAKNQGLDWLTALLGAKFFDLCEHHGELEKNEKNQFCTDCRLCLCKHCCVKQSTDGDACSHTHLLRITKYHGHAVVRLADIQNLDVNCTHIQVSTRGKKERVHLNARPPVNREKKDGEYLCEGCPRMISEHVDAYRFCSIACKVKVVNKEIDIPDNLEVEENSLDNS